MFRRLRIQLTFFCVLVISVILLSMTAVLLHLVHANEELNDFQDFEETINEICNEISGETRISHSRLDGLCIDNQLEISILDNGEPLLYRKNRLDTDTELLIEQARQTALDEYALSELSAAGSGSLTHKEFRMDTESGKSCLASVAYIPTEYGSLCVTAIRLPEKGSFWKSTGNLTGYIILTALCAAILLGVFSFFLIRYMVRPLEEGHARQVNFFADASHELRSPLAVLLSSLSAAEICPDQEERLLEIAKKEGLRMQRLVNDMFTLASLDNGRIAIRRQETCLYTLLMETYEKFEVPAARKNIFLEVSLPNETYSQALCDPERMSQVFTILFDNAISYTPEGGHILATISENRSGFTISVSDSGPGVPDEAKEKIFSRFYRCDTSRTDKEHFGLGLCIAKEIIELHGGTISVYDSDEGGARFVVTLPYA